MSERDICDRLFDHDEMLIHNDDRTIILDTEQIEALLQEAAETIRQLRSELELCGDDG